MQSIALGGCVRGGVRADIELGWAATFRGGGAGDTTGDSKVSYCGQTLACN